MDCSYSLKVMEKKSGHDEIKLEKREVSQQFVAALRAIRHWGKSLRRQGQGLGRGALRKDREISQDGETKCRDSKGDYLSKKEGKMCAEYAALKIFAKCSRLNKAGG